MIVELDHYLSLLRHKPGAFAHGVALSQARHAQRWPTIYDAYWQTLLTKRNDPIQSFQKKQSLPVSE